MIELYMMKIRIIQLYNLRNVGYNILILIIRIKLFYQLFLISYIVIHNNFPPAKLILSVDELKSGSLRCKKKKISKYH